MRYFTIALLATFWLSPIPPTWALEQPTTHQTERAAYPSVTPQGLEDLRLGAALPSHSEFPGLTYKAVKVPDYDEDGHAIARTFLKIYHKGFYLGQGMLDPQGRLVELEIVDWRVTYDQRFAAASTWKQVRGQLADVDLHYAYELDALVAESPDLPGLQVHFSPESYSAKSQLKGSFTPLSLDALPTNAKATRLRLFWIPNE